MEKEIKYVAPEALILSAQVERGVYASSDFENPNPGTGTPEEY